MSIISKVQNLLDKVLLPHGVLSHHLRRVEVDNIEGSDIPVNKNEYVVYRIVSNKGRSYGDGMAQLKQVYVDVNYYYLYDKNDNNFKAVEERLKEIKKYFSSSQDFKIANGLSDINDFDNPYRGVNIEFLYIGRNKDGW